MQAIEVLSESQMYILDRYFGCRLKITTTIWDLHLSGFLYCPLIVGLEAKEAATLTIQVSCMVN